MIINAFSCVGRSYEEVRNVSISLATLIGLIFVLTIQYPIFVLYLWLFSLGLAIGVFVLQRYVTPPSIWIFGFLFKLKYDPYEIQPVPLVKYAQCPVCEKQNCQRHEVKVISDKVWKGIHIPQKVNERLEEFCQLLLENYIYHWYNPISENQDFIYDVKCLFRHIVGSLIRIAMQLDIGKIVCEKLIPLGVVHLEKHIQTKKRYSTVHDVDELAELTLQEFNEDLHIALTSEENENKYLRSLVELIFPYLVPENRMTSQKAISLMREIVAMLVIKTGIDLIAEPDFINLLIRLLLDPESMREHKDPPSPCVELMGSFVGVSSTKHQLQYNLDELLFNPNNLYSFMQYLRKQGAINLLQCCLTVKERLVSYDKDIAESELRISGYKNEMRAFYDIYVAPDASDFIDFPDDITKSLKGALVAKYTPGQNPFKPVLLRVYEFLTDTLRKDYCIGYNQSDYYFLLLLGDRAAPSQTKLSSWGNKTRAKVTGLGAVFSTIKDKLSSNPMDPMMEMLDESAVSATQITNITNATSTALLGNPDNEEDIDFNVQTTVDLSRWVVEIKMTELNGEWLRQYVVYVIDVQTSNNRNRSDYEHMVVRRRFSEFVMLHKRLRKFHGNLNGLQLPQRKSMNALNSEFISYRQKELCIYLQKLLRNPSLKHSELIAKFLSPSCDDFNKIGLISMPKHAISSAGEVAGKMMQGVRPKEKTLYLHPFLKSVCKSVTPGYSGSLTTTSSEVGSTNSTPVSTPQLSRKFKGSQRDLHTPDEVKLGRELQEKARNELEGRRALQSMIFMRLTGVTECLLYALLLLGNLPKYVVHALCSVLLLIKNTLDHFVISFINFKIQLLLQEKEMVEVIELARDTLFFDTEVRGPAEVEERAQLAKHELLTKVPRVIRRLIGQERLNNALLTIYNGLQNKRLNKQLIYTLLDTFLGEILEELKEKEDLLVQDNVEDHVNQSPE